MRQAPLSIVTPVGNVVRPSAGLSPGPTTATQPLSSTVQDVPQQAHVTPPPSPAVCETALGAEYRSRHAGHSPAVMKPAASESTSGRPSVTNRLRAARSRPCWTQSTGTRIVGELDRRLRDQVNGIE